MKRLLAMCLAVIMVGSLAACGSSSSSKADTASKSSSSSSAASNSDGSSTADSNGDSSKAIEKLIPGKVCYFVDDKNVEQNIKGIRLDGNRTGKAADDQQATVNGRKPSLENIRSVFELNEYLNIFVDAKDKSDLKVAICKHHDNIADYLTSKFDSLEKAADVSLNAEAGNDESMGETYVNPDGNEKGSYDLVIFDHGTPSLVVNIVLYNAGELEGKSDSDLEKLMNDNIAAAK